jgi:hypothetical protein
MGKITFRKSLAALAVAATLGISMQAFAEDGSGFISGNSISSGGEKLGGVSITVKNIDTGLTRSALSDEDGMFRFPLLPAGKYSIEASKDGYSLSRQDSFVVSSSGKTNIDIALNSDSNMERIEVNGASISSFDISSSESKLVIDQELISRVPIARNLSSVALLAPGTSLGDGSFGEGSAIEGGPGFVSFGGASLAENAFLVNGLNLTNLRKGLGGSSVPFDFYDTFEVKTGGYSAEFGRALGGVVNATTKKGSNEFHAGVNLYWEPDSLRGDRDQVFQDNGVLHAINNETASESLQGNIWASGALVQDKLFYYVMFNPRSVEIETEQASTTSTDKSTSSFFGAKIDWNITDNHILELTYFSDDNEVTRSQDNINPDTRANEGFRGEGIYKRGGNNYIIKYTGIITDDFTISASYGKNEADRSDDNADPNTFLITDRDTGVTYGDAVVDFFERGADTRDVLRLDFDYYLGDHAIRFGYDNEDLNSAAERGYPGGYWYRYQNSNGVPLQRVRVRNNYQASQNFATDSQAYYIQDTWQVTENLVANIGVRNEEFVNYNGEGDAFIEIKDQISPRLGFAWDVMGDGESKLYANFGRYYIPVPTNTNVRVAGSELFTQKTCDVVSIDSDFVPTFDNCGGTAVFGDGLQKSTLAVVDANVKPMYQDEFILGYDFNLNDEWSMGVKGSAREVGVALEDVAVDYGFNQYLEREFGSGCTECTGFVYYVLGNPGSDMTITTDPDGDGPLALQQYTIPAEDLGYPEIIRKYYSLDVSFNRQWDGVWMLQGSYTWSHSYGNNEGFVRSDNGQDDAGITTNFDQPGLTQGAYGNLPNDRRHQVKVFGAYSLQENLVAGANFSFQSGRPKNAFGLHPTDEFAQGYGAASFFVNGESVPRGSLGNQPSTWQLDVSLTYTTKVGDYDLELRGDVYNILDNDKVQETEEVAEFDDGTPDPDYGLVDRYQAPRYVRLSASIKF